jgi:hypothetical protein
MPSVDSPIPFIDFADFGDGTGPVSSQCYPAVQHDADV